ncbi:MAG TPA: acyl-CoA dehydrogenase family protein [Gaiellaceae bacterium]
MDFSFTDEQQELRDSARSWLAERYPPERVAELAESEAGWDPESWSQLAELGWLGVSVPEEHGGAGLGFLEEAILLEELGYALYPGPYLATVALALPALDADEQAQVAAGRARWSVEVGGLVPDWGRVDRVVGGPAVGEAVPSIDPTRPLGRMPPRGGALGSRALAALACEAVGVAQRALEWGIEHARTREQFGKPIGVYQAVSHSLADSYVEIELARSLAYWAAWAVAEGDEQAGLASAAAKAQATEAAVSACERSIQVHGGIGFTWEHPLHRWYKRALWLEAFGGRPADHRAAVAAALLG